MISPTCYHHELRLLDCLASIVTHLLSLEHMRERERESTDPKHPEELSSRRRPEITSTIGAGMARATGVWYCRRGRLQQMRHTIAATPSSPKHWVNKQSDN
ncbi:hypothetical protein GOP47_0021119 [Adiantum capillus-veneris]|uniref:Uncharacterized protein n=1 Tax=Adiantum capillus-veneris TaxID=13818 RepID=A0A9D4Z7L3_ADICA|nr:hypothetical protein GOP47_0021119 [Adiantum capillus-veneris]